MDADALIGLSIRGARTLLDSRQVSAAELARAALDRVGAVDGQVRAFVTVTEDLAMS